MLAALPLFVYQLAWLADLARLKIYDKARQIGITFVETLDLVQRCLAARQRWYYLSISEERAAEAIEYAAMHCKALGAAARVESGWLEIDGIRFARTTITFPNGSKIIGLPANARTARGASGNLVLDEFAHHIDAAEIWKAAHAIATWGYHIHVISTPNGQQGDYYRIWTHDRQHDPEDIAEAIEQGRDICQDGWSRHLTTIQQASADGHPVDLATQRELAGTEDTWLQEYCCQFLDESLSWIPYSLLQSCTDGSATMHWGSTQRPTNAYLGFDVGRKRDLSVIWLNERHGKVATTRAVIEMPSTAFSSQRQQLWDAMKLTRRAHIDCTGIGAQLAEETVEKFGELRAKGVNFAGTTPAQLATQVRGAMERRELLIPDSDEIRRDFHSVRRTYTDLGKQTFGAPRGPLGHADRFWAAALALDAAREAWDGLKASDIATPGQQTRLERPSGRRDWGGY